MSDRRKWLTRFVVIAVGAAAVLIANVAGVIRGEHRAYRNVSEGKIQKIEEAFRRSGIEGLTAERRKAGRVILEGDSLDSSLYEALQRELIVEFGETEGRRLALAVEPTRQNTMPNKTVLDNRLPAGSAKAEGRSAGAVTPPACASRLAGVAPAPSFLVSSMRAPRQAVPDLGR